MLFQWEIYRSFFFNRSTHILTGVFEKKSAPVTLFYIEGFQFRVSYVGVGWGGVGWGGGFFPTATPV